MFEVLAWVTFHVTEDDVAIIPESSGALPMVCHYTSGPVRIENVYLLEDYTEEQAAAHGIRYYGGVILKRENLEKWSTEILGEFVLSSEDILNQ